MIEQALVPVYRFTTPEGWAIEIQWLPSGEIGIFGVNAAGERSGNPAFRLIRPNELGVVFTRGEHPSTTLPNTHGDPFKLDDDNRITNAGV